MRTALWAALVCLGLAACAGPGNPQSPAQVDESSATFEATAEPIASLGLHGRLLITQGEEGLWEFDAQTGEVNPLWSPPEGGVLEAVAASPAGDGVVFAYSPPREPGGSPIPRSSLYLVDLENGRLDRLLEDQGESADFLHPTWSPDGEWLYFTRSDVKEGAQGQEGVILNIERVRIDGGAPELVAANAEDFSVSADGGRAAYLAFDPETYARTLMAGEPHGGGGRELLAGSDFPYVATPRMSPDGTRVAFVGAPGESQMSPNPGEAALLARLTGADPASAHGLPADIWTLPYGGGTPVRRTEWATDAPVTAWSPDGQHLAALRPGGLFLLLEAGPRFLAPAAGHGDLDWTR